MELTATLAALLLLALIACVPGARGSVRALRRRRPLRAALGAGSVLPPLLVAVIASLLLAGGWGYNALTREEVAATVHLEPLGRQRFQATFNYPDGRQASYRLAGDELYVDARILKWRYFANLLGLHTAYELERVAGRYANLQQERSGPRTVFELGGERPVDLFALHRRFAWFDYLFDARYGSATFVPGDRPATWEIRVSTTGLMARRADS